MERIVAFRRNLQQRMAERVVPTAHGTAILSPSIRHVYDENYLSVETATVAAATLAAEADEAMADHFHRRVLVEDGTPSLAEEFAELGYDLSTHLVLAHRRDPDRRVDTSVVREISLDELLPARTVATLREPWGGAEIAAELNEVKRRLARAIPIRFFGAFADGELAGWCELRTVGGVAQIEDVEVLAEFRGRGLGRAVVQHALDAGLADGSEVFLEALADDWPRELYAKLGFVVVAKRDFYTKLPHPRTRVRLRTPRLELRLPTVAEARLVGAAAPAEDFVAFLDGQPIGVQPAIGEPWVLAAHEGRGYEDEMRAVADQVPA